MEEGDVCAMQDRSAVSDAWSDSSRKILAIHWDELRVALYTTEGVLIDEPLNFTPGGVQVFSSDHGNHSFTEEWGEGYYRVPQPPEEQREDAPVDSAALAAKLISGCRVLMPPPDSGSDTEDRPRGEPGTVILRRENKEGLATSMVVFNNSFLTPQYEGMDLTDQLVGKLKPNWFLDPGEDIPLKSQAAGVFLTRCQRKAEGIFTDGTVWRAMRSWSRRAVLHGNRLWYSQPSVCHTIIRWFVRVV